MHEVIKYGFFGAEFLCILLLNAIWYVLTYEYPHKSYVRRYTARIMMALKDIPDADTRKTLTYLSILAGVLALTCIVWSNILVLQNLTAK